MLRKVAAAITQAMEEVEARARLFTREHGKIVTRNTAYRDQPAW